MNPLSLFRLGAFFGHATPHAHATPDRVTVKRTNRDQLIDGLAFEPDSDTTAFIRAHLPNTPRAPDAPLRAALVARAYRHALRAGRRLSDEEGATLANAIDELSAYAIERGRA